MKKNPMLFAWLAIASRRKKEAEEQKENEPAKKSGYGCLILTLLIMASAIAFVIYKVNYP